MERLPNSTKKPLVKVTSVDQLKELSKDGEKYLDGGACFFIYLGRGIRSTKYIRYSSKNGRFWISNYIDDTTQFLTRKQLFTDSNIGTAIIGGNFYYNPDGNSLA